MLYLQSLLYLQWIILPKIIQLGDNGFCLLPNHGMWGKFIPISKCPILGKKLMPPPIKPLNEDRRVREHLLPDEIERLIRACKGTRSSQRNALLILLMYRHGLRVGEASALQWAQLDLEANVLYVRRAKNGVPSTHPLSARECRMLYLWRGKCKSKKFIFPSNRGLPIHRRTIHNIISLAGEIANLPFPCHPHMLRHACGYYLANSGQDTRAIQAYLGHRQIENTVKYTALASDRFKDFWKD